MTDAQRHERDLGRFAEALAQERSVNQSAWDIDKSALWGWKAMNEICERLGPQAR